MTAEPLRTADFDYDLPPELIAQEPIGPRDQARLLVVDRGQQRLEHRRNLLQAAGQRPGRDVQLQGLEFGHDPLERLLGYVEFRKSILEGTLPEFTCLLGTLVLVGGAPAGSNAPPVASPPPRSRGWGRS